MCSFGGWINFFFAYFPETRKEITKHASDSEGKKNTLNEEEEQNQEENMKADIYQRFEKKRKLCYHYLLIQ